MVDITADASSCQPSDGRSGGVTGSSRSSGGRRGGRARLPAEEALAAPSPGKASPVQRKDTPSLQVRQRPRLATGAALQWQQLAALTNKNLIIRGRSWKTNLLLILQAVLFISLVWVVDRAVSVSRQRQPAFSRVEAAVPQRVGSVPDCGLNPFMRAGQPCYTFLYAPAGDPDVEAVVRGVVAHNDPPLPPQHILGLPNASAVDAWLLRHPETVLAAILFSPPDKAGSAGLAGANAAPGAMGASPGLQGSQPTASAVGSMPTALPFGVPAAATLGAGLGAGAIPSNATAPAALQQQAGTSGLSPTAAGAQLVPAVRQLGFFVQTNSSVQWFKGHYQHPNTYMQLPLQVAVEREIARHFTGNASLGWDVGLAQFPHPTAKSPSMIGQFAPTFLFASIMFQFVLLVHDMVEEKEGRARQIMATMGLRPLPFWASWVLFQGLLAVVEACLLVGFGYAFGFRLFTANAFGLSFLLILLVSLAMTAFGFFMSAFLHKASAAVPCGFLLFVVAWVILIVVAFGFPFSSSYNTAAVAAFSAMPWSLLSKGVQDLASATDGRRPGIPWADRFAYCQPGATLAPGVQLAGDYWQPNCVMPLGHIFWVLAVQCAGFMTLAIYLDAVLPDANGVRAAPWFFLQPSYWRRSGARGSVRAAAKALAAPTEAECGLTVDADVSAEQRKQRRRCAAYLRRQGVKADALRGSRQTAWNAEVPAERHFAGGKEAGGERAAGVRDEECGAEVVPAEGGDDELAPVGRPYAVEMFGLRKVYKRGGLLRRRKPFVAVRGNWLGVYQGECFCLLGPNGAGKSTTINCLTGVLPFDGGDALVCGTSLAGAGGMDRARPLMGVCPQFDVLWDQLTGREHLMLFGAIKGLPRGQSSDEAVRLLDDVRLTEAGGVRAGAYSGGMKRRLSVAIALLGDPQVVYLDEPTTGLDPISRRHLWDLVERAKRDRAVVLTTHSMEEADILGDRIGIMARGRLRCIGRSLHLKARFGSGYQVSIRLQGSSSAASAAHSTAASAGNVAATGIAGSGSYSNPLCEIEPDPAAAPPAAGWEPGQRQGSSSHAGGGGGGSSGSGGSCRGSGRDLQKQEHRRDPAAAHQAAAVRALFMSELGLKPSDESPDYVHFMIPSEHEDRLPWLFSHMKAHRAALGVADVQMRLTPLEEVFLNVARKAELEHAQLEGRREALSLVEEGVVVQVPIGADFIQSPAGHLYHILWGQDPDTGELKLQEYYRDAVSGAVDAAAAVVEATAAGTAGSSPVAVVGLSVARPAAKAAAAARVPAGEAV